MESNGGLACDVLVLEDDPLAATLLDTVITKRAGLTVRSYASLEEGIPALRAAASGREGQLPKAIIVDWNLRTRTAKEFITWVRISDRMGHLPIYVITADEDRTLKQIALDAGATEFCAKGSIIPKLDEWMSAVVAISAA